MKTTTFTADNTIDLKNKMLNWANQFNIFCLLDNNNYTHDLPAFDCILAAGNKRSIQLSRGHSFAALKDFHNQKASWLFGHLGYDLKDEVENVNSRHEAFIDFGMGFFFEPEVVVRLRRNEVFITCEGRPPEEIYECICTQSAEINNRPSTSLALQSRITKDAYLQAVDGLKHHIRRGDCYEINFCHQFFAENAILDPLYTYSQLVQNSPNPFAAFYKLNGKYCLCASPERYLKKAGNSILSQPIKGTSKRYAEDGIEDVASKNNLRNSSKDRTENVMVVDLVRNDLSRISKEGSVHVEELYGVYSFPQVHQMISSIKAELADDIHWTEAINATFPMGSMTGAPKKRVMELIDEFEASSRGLFSGAIGYITPNADFDFNVVIRSIFYDEIMRKLSFSVGSAITFASNSSDEYEETLLKAEAIVRVLGIKNAE